MKNIYTLILAVTVLLYSCKTATKAFEKGNYEDAVELAVKKLQKNGNDDDTKALLQQAYNYAVNQHEALIRNLSNSTSDNRYEKIYNEYRKLQSLYDAIHNSPIAMQAVSATDYSSYVLTYKEKTGEMYFDKGLALMEKGDRASFRQAYDALRTAYRFKNDSQIKAKMDEAFDEAVVRIVLTSDDLYGSGSFYDNGTLYGNNGYGNSYAASYQVKEFQDDLIRNLRYNSSSEFVQFYSEWDARANNIVPDEIVEMHLGRLDMGRSYDETSYRDVSKQVVIKQIVYKPDSVVNEYGTVKARITTTKRNYVSYGDLNITSRNADGRYLWSDVVRGESRFSTQFSSFTGDERALSESDKTSINNSQSYVYDQVKRDEVLREVMRQIEYEASNRFRSYYSRYY